jgi:quercetin dioxygenase-like cupin family protein
MPRDPDTVGNKSDGIFFIRGSDAPAISVEALDGISMPKPVQVRILLPGPKASLFEFRFARGQELPAHRYTHDTIYYVVKGEASVTLGSSSYSASARDAWAAAAGVEIGIQAIEDCTILEWMSPQHLVVGTNLVSWGPPPAPSTSHIFTNWHSADNFLLERVEGETDFAPPDVDIEHRVRVMIPGPYGSLIWNSHKKEKWALHTHQHHWVVYLIKGVMRERFGGDLEFIARAGDIWAAQAGAEHLTQALEDNEIVEFKWPAPMLWRGIIQSWEPRAIPA